ASRRSPPAATITTPSPSSCRACWKRSRRCLAAPPARRVEPAVSGGSPVGRLDQAVAAFLRQQFGSPVTAMIGYIDILIEDARRERLESCLPDLERMRSAAAQLLALIGRVVDGAAGDIDSGTLRHELR